jgi:hypothetical protein
MSRRLMWAWEELTADGGWETRYELVEKGEGPSWAMYLCDMCGAYALSIYELCDCIAKVREITVAEVEAARPEIDVGSPCRWCGEEKCENVEACRAGLVDQGWAIP